MDATGPKDGEQPAQTAGCSRMWGSLRLREVYGARSVPINAGARFEAVKRGFHTFQL